MVEKQLGLIALVVLGMVGCATAMAPKPDLDVLGYSQAAKMYVGVNRCGTSGLMDSTTAAYGVSFVKALINRYTYSLERLNGEIEKWGQDPIAPTKEQCNQMAMGIQEWKQGQQVSAIAPTPQPMYTTCNKIGTQTFCNSY